MNTKKLFSTLLTTGTRLTILASMLMTALIGTATPALAAVTAEIVPTGNGNYTAWSGNFNDVNEGIGAASCSGGDSVTSSTNNARESYVISLVGIPDGSTITSIDVLARDRGDSNPGGTYATFVRFNGANSANSATHTASGSSGGCTGSRTDTFDVVDTLKASGTTLEIGVIKINSGGITNRSVRVGVLSAVVTYTAPMQNQTISFTSTAPLGATVGGATYTPTATATSGLVVAFTVDASASSICSISAGVVSFQSVGTCVINANQAGNASYNAAPQVQQSFAVTAASSGTASFDLYAVAGATTLPGSVTVPVWGYTSDGITPLAKPGGPVLTVNQNDSVTITLHNNLSETTALLFQGQNMIPDLTGATAGGTKAYTFTASKPGTFLYEAGLIPGSQHQVAMGLYGALIVRPAGAPAKAYAGSPDFAVEQTLVLSELDTALNNSSNPAAFDMRTYSPKYYLINGKAYPSTDPISAAAGNIVLLRYVNAGLQAHAMSTLGLSQSILGQDGSAFTNPHSVVSETIAPGQTLDTLVTAGADGATYPIYDASLFLRNNTGAGLGGMLTTLTVGTGTPPPPPSDTTGPIASALGLSSNPADGSLAVTVTATINDGTTGGSNINQAEFYIDSTASSANPMTASDLAFDSTSESVTGTISVSMFTILAAGDHTVYVRGHDVAGNWGNFATITLTFAPPASGLLFSTSGTTASGPSGVGADAADIYIFNGSAFSAASAINAITPSSVNVDGFDQASATTFYASFTGDVTLPGAGLVQNEDVVFYNGSTWSVPFDGTGLVDSTTDAVDTNVDAISVVGGTLYFSTNDTTLPTGVSGVGDDADIYSWNGSTIARVFDATALGWSSNNVDGFVYVDADTFYLSYSPTSTTVAGLGTVQDEDVIKYDAGVWSIYFDGTAHGLTDTALDIDALDIP